MNLMSQMTTVVTVSMALSMGFWSMSEQKKEDLVQKTSFECGFMNMGTNKMTFSTKFIMTIILFIMFDIEVSILIPMMMSSKSLHQEKLMTSTFLLILTGILLKEWEIGSIEWSK